VLGHDIAAALPDLRRQAESRMTEVGRVILGHPTVDPDTLEDFFEIDETVYDGIGRIRFPQVPNAEVDAAGQIALKQDAILSLPWGTSGITPDMRYICDDSTDDATLAGRVFRIKGFAVAGQTTATRFTVEETGEVIPEEES
jgi:hypothetical protein